MKSAVSAFGAAVSAALLGTVLLGAACGGSGGAGGGSTGSGGTTTTSSTGGTGGVAPPPPPTFAPPGCGFSVRARPEYEQFGPGAEQLGASVSIARVRLGLGGNVAVGGGGRADPSTTIGVAWQSDEGTLASTMAWGTDPDPTKWPAGNRAQGVTWRTPATGVSGLPPERMHEAYVCGLTPDTTYYYRVGGGPAGGEVWSEVHSFRTTPAAGAAQVTIGFAGDSRGESGDAWRLYSRRLRANAPHLAIFAGDMTLLPNDQAAWEHWLDSAWKDADGSLLSLGQSLTLFTHGNHESHSSLYFGNLVLPQDVTAFPTWPEFFYSTDVGPVHVVVVDDYWIISTANGPEYRTTLGKWLDADLAAAEKNRAAVPWIVVAHHHGEFSSSKHGAESDVLRGREFFVPIWDKHHVDLVLAGHDHDYERTKPLHGPLVGDDLVPTVESSPAQGTVYITCSGVGAPAYAPGTSAFTELSHGFGSSGALGLYGLLTAGKKTLVFEGRELRADASDPVFDTLTITKP